ncbi:hypothetical protein MUP65_00035, partial [Patescibacteria group bacterium]|nr:hypothetical protein [Patescibacteria group bacterium]
MPISSRIKFISGLFLLIFGLIVARLGYWQFGQQEALALAGQKQYLDYKTLLSYRGQILAQDLFPLATNKTVYDLAVSLPQLIESRDELVERIAPHLVEPCLTENEDEVCPSWSEQVLTKQGQLSSRLQTESVWVPLVKNVDRESKEEIDQLEIEGLYFEESEQRIYPEGTASAHLLGFVGYGEDGERQGYFGLEGWYNRELGGQDGLAMMEKDAVGRPIIFGLSR